MPEPNDECIDSPPIANQSDDASIPASVPMSISNDSSPRSPADSPQHSNLTNINLSQTIKQYPELTSPTNLKSLANIDKDRKMINQIRKLNDPHQQRQFFKDLIKEHPHLQRDCYFYIGNSYEVAASYTKAIGYYQKAMECDNPYTSSLAVYHQFFCMQLSKEYVYSQKEKREYV